jgi:membrane protease subunit HflK
VALVLRFGRLRGAVPAEQIHRPGLLWALPRPIDQVLRVPVERIRELEIEGLDRPDPGPGELPFEPLGPRLDPTVEGFALTADRNVLQTRARVRFRVADPLAYALATADPEGLVRRVVQASLVRLMAETPVDVLLRSRRESLGRELVERAGARLTALGAGVELLGVEIRLLTPPAQLVPDFVAVNGARLDATRSYQEALAYRAQELPGAEGQADRLRAEARIEAAEGLALARGRAASFSALYDEYRTAPEVVRERLWRETVERTVSAAGRTMYVPPDLEDLRLTVPARR